jgi:hypothetical protein
MKKIIILMLICCILPFGINSLETASDTGNENVIETSDDCNEIEEYEVESSYECKKPKEVGKAALDAVKINQRNKVINWTFAGTAVVLAAVGLVLLDRHGSKETH